ncbi:threonine/serine dehydratase [Neorhizobium galegae]|uniref:Threonine/serine dehydratase n=1 Tax=Neorhizobium galegae TaxID=399 RepID=A0A6A1TK62_NEOGA|nr:threonine/serine dehydratase [Neorhizobium galegae]KAB1083720.1 threonine/serine dehydratase [Neorhizobium galegae]
MSGKTLPVQLDDILAAAVRIDGRVCRTPMVASVVLSERMGVPVHLKLEHHQATGSFKLRGATNAILSLTREERARGVVAASTGNHGRALAFAASAEGAVATICMSSLVPENKVAEIRRLGARVRIIGRSQDEAQEEVDRLVAEEGLAMVPPFDHPAVVAGQGTLGLEIVEQVPEIGTVLVPLSGGIGLDNRVTFAMCRDLLDDVVLLSEAEIAAGIAHAYSLEREVVEGAAAVGIGALLTGKVKSLGAIVALLSGRNIDMEQHRRVINGDAIHGKDAA